MFDFWPLGRQVFLSFLLKSVRPCVFAKRLESLRLPSTEGVRFPVPNLSALASLIRQGKTQERKRHMNINLFDRSLPGVQGPKIDLCTILGTHSARIPDRIGDRGDQTEFYVLKFYVPFLLRKDEPKMPSGRFKRGNGKGGTHICLPVRCVSQQLPEYGWRT